MLLDQTSQVKVVKTEKAWLAKEKSPEVHRSHHIEVCFHTWRNESAFCYVRKMQKILS